MSTLVAAHRSPSRALLASFVHAWRVLVFVAMAGGLAAWMLVGVIAAAIAAPIASAARRLGRRPGR